MSEPVGLDLRNVGTLPRGQYTERELAFPCATVLKFQSRADWNVEPACAGTSTPGLPS